MIVRRVSLTPGGIAATLVVLPQEQLLIGDHNQQSMVGCQLIKVSFYLFLLVYMNAIAKHLIYFVKMLAKQEGV